MPSTHRDNGVSMGGTLKRLSTLKKLKHFGGLKRPGKLVGEFSLINYTKSAYSTNKTSSHSACLSRACIASNERKTGKIARGMMDIRWGESTN